MRTLNGKILINDKGELNEQVWLDNCIAVGELLAERTRRSTTDGLIDLAVVEADRKTENSSEKPNNSTRSKMEQVDKEYPRCVINGTPFDECGFCEHFNCDTCKCEAQTERSSE